jgi:hypothetical protein
MSSLQNMPYDLLLSIAQHLDLADIYTLQLVRNNLLLTHKFELMPFPRHASTYATRSTLVPYIESWPSASSAVAAHSRSTVSNVFLIFRQTNLSRS